MTNKGYYSSILWGTDETNHPHQYTGMYINNWKGLSDEKWLNGWMQVGYTPSEYPPLEKFSLNPHETFQVSFHDDHSKYWKGYSPQGVYVDEHLGYKATSEDDPNVQKLVDDLKKASASMKKAKAEFEAMAFKVKKLQKMYQGYEHVHYVPVDYVPGENCIF